jgi:hypothetical protein
MSNGIEELKEIFPSAKEIKVGGKMLVVKPMVWVEFIIIIEEFGKVMGIIAEKYPDFDLSNFNEKKDLGKLVPVINEILTIFAKWLNVELEWLKSILSLKGTMQLLIEFLEVNEWNEVKELFLELKSNVQTKMKE